MSAPQQSSYWEQDDSEASPDNRIHDPLPTYSESIASQTALSSTSGQSSRLTKSKIKSAIWSYLKGDIYKHHPAFAQERYFNAMMEAQKTNDRSRDGGDNIRR